MWTLSEGQFKQNLMCFFTVVILFIVSFTDYFIFSCMIFKKKKEKLLNARPYCPAKASGIGTRDRVSCLQKKRSEFELFTQIFFYILLKCQSITAVCLDSLTAIEISLLDLSFIACQRT